MIKTPLLVSDNLGICSIREDITVNNKCNIFYIGYTTTTLSCRLTLGNILTSDTS